MSTKKILCVGNINFDIIYSVDRLPEDHEKLKADKVTYSGGGAASNTAYWLAKLGMPVSMYGYVGNDIFGQFCIEEMTEAGVDTSYIRTSFDQRTNIVSVFSGKIGKRMVSGMGANSLVELDFPVEILEEFDHVHIASRSEALHGLINDNSKIYDYTTSSELSSWCSEGLPNSDILFINQDEYIKMFSTTEFNVVQKILKSAQLFVVTRGSLGAVAITNSSVTTQAAETVEVVDRTGGGDAFDSGFIYSYVDDGDIQTSLASGQRLAERVLCLNGARGRAENFEIGDNL